MLSENDSEGSKLVQIGESILNQTIDIKRNPEENGSESSQTDNLYFHVVQLSNFLQSLNSKDVLQESDVHQVLHFLTNVYRDLTILEKIPSPEVGPQSPVNESYKALAYTLYILLKNHNIEFHTKTQEETDNLNIKENKNSALLENSTELLNFLAEEYDLPRNLTEKEIITSIKEYKKNESSLSLSPKKDVNSEVRSLKIKIEKLQNSQKESEESSKEKIDALVKINEVQKREISKLKKQNQTLQSQVNMAITEAISFSKSTSPDKIDDINQARLNLLENDIRDIKEQYNELKNKKHKLSLENQQLKNENQKHFESEKAKDSQIIELKHALSKLKIENEQLNNTHEINQIYDTNNAEIKIKADENKRLNNALTEISTHLKSLNSEISIESNKSNVLYELSQKLLMTMDKYDSLLKEKEKEAAEYQALLNECQLALRDQYTKFEKTTKDADENGQIIEELKNYISSKSITISNHLSNKLTQIFDSQNTPIQKVLIMTDYILKKYMKKKAIVQINKNSAEQNDRLFDFCSSLLLFFEKLADSGEMQQWIIGTPQDDTFRLLLLSQCNRIESFLKQHSDEISLNYEDFLEFPSRIEKVIENDIENHPLQREVILLFQLCSTANDALRRYATNLSEDNRTLAENVAELRHELQQVNNECRFTFDEMQKTHESIYSQTETETEIENPKFIQVMQIIGESKQQDKENEEQVIKKIADILGLKKKNKSKKNRIQNLTQENEKLRNELSQSKQQNMESVEQMKIILNENIELKKNENNYQIKMDQMQNIIDNQKNELKGKNENNDKSELIEILKEEIESWKTRCSSLETEKTNIKNSLKREFSKNFSKIQKENEELTSTNEKLKIYYEKLLDEVQTKLDKTVESESKLTNDLKNANLELSQINSELSTTKVENKMLKLKISASDEKMQREKNLLETHFKMEMLNSETKHETEKQRLKSEYEKQFHDFIVTICERFKDFFDFNQPISESSVQELLNRVEVELKSRKDRLSIFELYSNEMNSVRSILGIDDSQPVVPIIAKLVKKLNKMPIEFIENSRIESNNDQTALEWEQWAEKLLLMISDNLAPVQSTKYVQYAIGEAVMAGISQRSLIKKINILRKEKILMKIGKIYIKSKNKRININTLILVLACIRRLQINSCHLPSAISKPIQINNNHVDENIDTNSVYNDGSVTNDQAKPKTKKKNYPIIT